MDAEMSISSGNSSTFSHSEKLSWSITCDPPSTLSLLLTLFGFVWGPSHQCRHPVAESKWSREGSSYYSNCFGDCLTYMPSGFLWGFTPCMKPSTRRLFSTIFIIMRQRGALRASFFESDTCCVPLSDQVRVLRACLVTSCKWNGCWGYGDILSHLIMLCSTQTEQIKHNPQESYFFFF